MAGGSIRSEFSFKKFGVGDVHPGRFVYSQWRLPPLLYILYRISLAVYTDYWLIETGIQMESMRQRNNTNQSSQMFVFYSFPVYLTNWTYFMLSLYLTFHAICALCHYFGKFRTINCLSRPNAEGHRSLFNELSSTPSFWDEDRVSDNDDDPIVTLYTLPWYFKVTYILYSIASAASILVTIAFFGFLWPQLNKNGESLDMLNLQLHGINSVIVFVDLLIHAIPIRLLHAIHTMIYGVVYVIFTVIFYAAGNHDAIYPNLLDWNRPGPTFGMVLGIALVGIPLIYVFMFAIHKVKLTIYHKVTPWSTL